MENFSSDGVHYNFQVVDTSDHVLTISGKTSPSAHVMCVFCAIESVPTPGGLWVTDVHRVLSSAALCGSCRLMRMASFTESVQVTVACTLFLCFPSTTVFSKEPCLHDGPEEGQLQFYHLPSSNMSGLLCSRTHLSAFPALSGVHTGLLQHHIPKETFPSHQPSSLSSFDIQTQ